MSTIGWRKRQVVDMAKEVKMPYDFVTGEPINLEKLETFAELVRADEREQAEERVTDLFANMETPYLPDITDAIRARSKDEK